MNFVRPLKPLPLMPRRVYLRTMVGAIEALRTGTTTLVDDLNVSPVLDPDHVAAVFQAYEDIGIRALVGPTLFDRPFFRGMPFVDEEFPERAPAVAGRGEGHPAGRDLRVRPRPREHAAPGAKPHRLHRGAVGAAALHPCVPDAVAGAGRRVRPPAHDPRAGDAAPGGHGTLAVRLDDGRVSRPARLPQAEDQFDPRGVAQSAGDRADRAVAARRFSTIRSRT